MAESIIVVGLPPAAPLPAVELYVGGRRHLASAPAGAATATIAGDVEGVLERIAREPGRVCVLASGDPGFFGIVRALADRFGPGHLEVRPAPSSVSLAFARLGLPWDDALVVSAHGRPLAEAARLAARAGKVAVLTSPTAPPEALGKELAALGAETTTVAVCSRLGLPGELVLTTDLAGLGAGSWDPLSVVVLLTDRPVPGDPSSCWPPGPPPSLAPPPGTSPPGSSLAGSSPAGISPAGSSPADTSQAGSSPASIWGRSEASFAHRAGMITRPEVRAVVLARLELPTTGVLWDLGAGSGSVAIEAALLAPGLTVIAIERRGDDAGRIRANAGRLGARLTVIEGEAPSVLDGLAEPDRIFVGGGGLGVLDAALVRLRPGGRVVAAYAAMDRAAVAADRLGQLVQVTTSPARRLPDGGWRLEGTNPVFIAWGPETPA